MAKTLSHRSRLGRPFFQALIRNPFALNLPQDRNFTVDYATLTKVSFSYSQFQKDRFRNCFETQTWTAACLFQ